MNHNDIIIRPLFTEKMTQLEDIQRKYAFQVSQKSNKIDIKNAIERRFDVEVQKVATMNRLGKTKDMTMKVVDVRLEPQVKDLIRKQR